MVKAYFKVLVPFILLAIALSLGFQNCGNGYEAYEEDVFASQNPLGRDNVRLIYQEPLAVTNSGRQFRFLLLEVNDEQPHIELRVITSLRGEQSFSFEHPSFEVFQKYPPKVAHRANTLESPIYLYFLSDDERQLMMLQIHPDQTVNILWQLGLATPLSYQDFLYEMTARETDDRYYFVKPPYIIRGTKSQRPSIETCDLENYEISTDQCVARARSCPIDNGTGQQVWTGEAWSSCRAIDCLPSHHLVDDLRCEPNVIACSDSSPGSAGNIRWNSDTNQYGPCVINRCNQEGYHLENGTCMSDRRECLVNNGSGVEAWNGASYDACTATQCDNHYQVTSTTPATCEPVLDGSIVRYVQAHTFTANQMANACSELGFPMQPVGCIAGEAREREAADSIEYVYGTYGGFSRAGSTIINGTYCYKAGQKRDNDGTDRVVGIKCSNVPAADLTFN